MQVTRPFQAHLLAPEEPWTQAGGIYLRAKGGLSTVARQKPGGPRGLGLLRLTWGSSLDALPGSMPIWIWRRDPRAVGTGSLPARLARGDFEVRA